MKKLIFFIILLVFFSGCTEDRDIVSEKTDESTETTQASEDDPDDGKMKFFDEETGEEITNDTPKTTLNISPSPPHTLLYGTKTSIVKSGKKASIEWKKDGTFHEVADDFEAGGSYTKKQINEETLEVTITYTWYKYTNEKRVEYKGATMKGTLVNGKGTLTDTNDKNIKMNIG